MQVCRRFSSPANALIRCSLSPPPRIQIYNNDLQPFLRRLQSTKPSSAQNVHTNTVNAPITTLPVPLELPTKEPGASTFTYLLKTGKAYLSFYKTGIKNVYHNFISARPIQDRIDKLGSGSITNLVTTDQITRSEFQLIMRSRHDTRCIPIFIIVFIVFGELSPFILPFISTIVPWNCRIPSQLQGDREKLEKRRKAAFEKRGAVASAQAVFDAKREVDGLVRGELLHCSNVLGIHSPKWPEASLPPTAWLRLRLRRRIEYLALDDTLLERGGGPKALDAGEELMMAVVERGLDTIGKTDNCLREKLNLWFAMKEKAGGLTPALWLTKKNKKTKPADLSFTPPMHLTRNITITSTIRVEVRLIVYLRNGSKKAVQSVTFAPE